MYYNVTISCKLKTSSEALQTGNNGMDFTGLTLNPKPQTLNPEP